MINDKIIEACIQLDPVAICNKERRDPKRTDTRGKKFLLRPRTFRCIRTRRYKVTRNEFQLRVLSFTRITTITMNRSGYRGVAYKLRTPYAKVRISG